MSELPFKIVVDDRVPPDRVYALDPKAARDLFWWLQLDGDEKKIVAVHSQHDADRIINSPEHVAALAHARTR